MTVTFVLTDSQLISVSNSITSSSNVITSLIFDTGLTDVIIEVPNAYILLYLMFTLIF